MQHIYIINLNYCWQCIRRVLTLWFEEIVYGDSVLNLKNKQFNYGSKYCGEVSLHLLVCIFSLTQFALTMEKYLKCRTSTNSNHTAVEICSQAWKRDLSDFMVKCTVKWLCEWVSKLPGVLLLQFWLNWKACWDKWSEEWVCTELTYINDPGQDGETLVISHSTLPNTGRRRGTIQRRKRQNRETGGLLMFALDDYNMERGREGWLDELIVTDWLLSEIVHTEASDQSHSKRKQCTLTSVL